MPEHVRVKLSSEAAGALSLTPVVVEQLTVKELLGHVLCVTGKDEPRIREVLRRGSMVSGATRFRWDGWEPDAAELSAALAHFPGDDPSRVFTTAACACVLLRGGRGTIEIPREAATGKRLLRRTSFWDVLMAIAEAATLTYSGYSHRDSVDRYRRELTAEEIARIRAAAEFAKFSGLRMQVEQTAFTSIELRASR